MGTIDTKRAFEALTGHEPAPWQGRLLCRLMDGAPPEALDVPTGLGKTAVMAAWLAARALGAAVPRRLAYVVDRRAVVDQASAEAARLADRLDPARWDALAASGAPLDREALAALREGLALGDERLAIATMRGQHVDQGDWLRSLARPAIAVGTVDMTGSRLLFSGYGVGRGMRPVQAALLGYDALIVIDESHLVPPYEHMVRAVTALAGAAPEAHRLPVSPSRVMALSATGRAAGDAISIEPGDAEEDSDFTGRRLDAVKRLGLEAVPANGLAEAAAERAVALAGQEGRVVVFLSSRRDAAAAIKHLTKALKDRMQADGEDVPRGFRADVARLTGQLRVRERAALTGDAVYRRFSEGTHGDGPAFLVATSAGEVGVDLSADHMVCDLAPWERMVQRLGRVNRDGAGEAVIDVLVPDDPKAEDRHTAWRAPFEHGAWTCDEEGRRDASPGALRALKDAEGFAAAADAASTPEPFRPPLSLPLVEAWAMTSLDHHAGRPEVDPWLRGWVDNDDPTVRLAWRCWLPKPEDVNAYLGAAPVHVAEALDAGLGDVTDVIGKRVKAVRRARDERATEDLPSDDALAALHATHDGEKAALTLSELDALLGKGGPRLGPGETLVLDARLGGLDADGALDAKAVGPVTTWDERDWTPREGELAESRGPDGFYAVPRRLVRSGTAPAEADPRFERRWRSASFRRAADPSTEDGEVVEIEAERRPTAADPARAGRAQGLDEHHAWTREAAEALCAALGMEDALAAAVMEGAGVHDAGKDRALWQDAMGAPKDTTRPYAKTEGGGHGETHGYRHEFGSLRDAISAGWLDGLEERDLALHLVASHHGWARPHVPPLDPDASRPLLKGQRGGEAADAAADAALRYANLTSRFGPYGLAWLEGALRGADWDASARNEARDE